jgi:hypothetical protein
MPHHTHGQPGLHPLAACAVLIMSTVWSVGYATRPRGTGEVFAPALGFGWAAVRAKRGRIAKMENCMLDERVKLVVRFSELEELQMEEGGVEKAFYASSPKSCSHLRP